MHSEVQDVKPLQVDFFIILQIGLFKYLKVLRTTNRIKFKAINMNIETVKLIVIINDYNIIHK